MGARYAMDMPRKPTRAERDKDEAAGKLCGAKRRNGAGPCRHFAGLRTDHPGTGKCYLHGGATRNHSKAAIKQEIAQRIAQEATFGDAKDVTPPEALAGLLHTTSAHVGWLAGTLATLPKEALGSPYGMQLTHLYGVERDRLAQVAKLCSDAHVDERLVAIQEQQTRLLGEALRAACLSIGMKETQQRKLGTALRQELAVLEAEPVPVRHKVLGS
jgi:hypothetical protein